MFGSLISRKSRPATKSVIGGAVAPHALDLTDLQLIVLSRAAQDPDCVVPLSAGDDRAHDALDGLLKAGFVVADPETACMDEGNHHGNATPKPIYRITPAGLTKIGLGDQEATRVGGSAPENAVSHISAATGSPDQVCKHLADDGMRPPGGEGPPTVALRPREVGKTATILALLRRDVGADIASLEAATGWQAHSIRASLTGFRKRGYVIERSAGPNDKAIYRVKDDVVDATMRHSMPIEPIAITPVIPSTAGVLA